jgi:ERCC4-type nuclease
MNLIVDTREPQAIKNGLQSRGVLHQVKMLDVGDYMFMGSNEEPVLIIERKTCSDLASSVTDGRYREQKLRLLSAPTWCRGYIIEGIYPTSGIKQGKRIITRSTADSICLGLEIRDKMCLWQTVDMEHTIDLLVKLMSKLPEYQEGNVDIKEGHQECLVKSLGSKRMDNMTPQTCYLSQLCQIPGVSIAIAKAIICRYPCMFSLLQALQKDGTKAISELCLTSGRRIGIISQTIHEYLVSPTKMSSLQPLKPLKPLKPLEPLQPLKPL